VKLSGVPAPLKLRPNGAIQICLLIINSIIMRLLYLIADKVITNF